MSYISTAFKKAFNGEPNFLTPNIESHGKSGEYLWELSYGRGFSDNTIWGVTVLTKAGKKTSGISQGGFSTRGEAVDYILSLKTIEPSEVTV